MFLAQIVVHGPREILAMLRRKSEKLVFETVERFGLLRAVIDPIIERDRAVDLVRGPDAHVKERQKIEQVRT